MSVQMYPPPYMAQSSYANNSYGNTYSPATQNAPCCSPAYGVGQIMGNLGQTMMNGIQQGFQKVGQFAQRFVEERPYVSAGIGVAGGMAFGAAVCPYGGACMAAGAMAPLASRAMG